eukprot:scaffold73532_cov16-Prasinocladus_malaysianus.AAC.1
MKPWVGSDQVARHRSKGQLLRRRRMNNSLFGHRIGNGMAASTRVATCGNSCLYERKATKGCHSVDNEGLAQVDAIPTYYIVIVTARRHVSCGCSLYVAVISSSRTNTTSFGAMCGRVASSSLRMAGGSSDLLVRFLSTRMLRCLRVVVLCNDDCESGVCGMVSAHSALIVDKGLTESKSTSAGSYWPLYVPEITRGIVLSMSLQQYSGSFIMVCCKF